MSLTACTGAAEPEMAIMGEEPATLPAWAGEAEGTPVADLTRVGALEYIEVFASRDKDDNWCVIMAIEPNPEGEDWSTAASCVTPEQFMDQGALVSGGGQRFGGALLLPDGFTGEIEEDFERINDNLAVKL